MTVEVLRAFLGWSVLLHLVFALWALTWVGLLRGFVQGLSSRWFRLSPERFDGVHHSILNVYAVFAWAFYLIPWLVLHLIR